MSFAKRQAAGSRKARGYAGVNKLRKTFKRLEPEIQAGVTKELKWAAREIEADAIGFAIMKDIKVTGDMIHSISWKIGSDKSSVVIGPGAEATVWQKNPFDNTSIIAAKMSITQKTAKWQFMKGYWAEFGTEHQDPQSFMNEAFENNKGAVAFRIQGAVNNALEQATR